MAGPSSQLSSSSLSDIPNIIAVLSGKGGVGKSSVTVQLALTLSLRGHNVGVLDIDLTGPSIPRLFGIEEGKVRQAPGGWLPVPLQHHTSSSSSQLPPTSSSSARRGTIHVMSLGFLLGSRGDAVIWRGPKKTAMVGQLLSDTLWPAGTEYLLVDTPPGTSDEHISLMTALLDPARVDPARAALAAVLVTTPQAIATADVKKELSFCGKVGLKVAGVIENMAGYVCPCCGQVTHVFSKGGGEVMARDWAVRFLGSVPLDAGDGWAMLVEQGRRPGYGSASSAVTNGPSGEEEEDEVSDDGGKGDKEGKEDDDEATRGTMAEKYTSCALYPIFESITADIVQILNSRGAKLPSIPSTSSTSASVSASAATSTVTANNHNNNGATT